MMACTRFATVFGILFLCITSISCSCEENIKAKLLRKIRSANDEGNVIINTSAGIGENIENLSDGKSDGFFKSFELTETARRLLPSSEDLKNICRKYLASYETTSATEVPPLQENQENSETPPITTDYPIVTLTNDNETIAEDNVDQDDQAGKFYGHYGYYQGYFPSYPTVNNYGAPPGFSNGYQQNGGNQQAHLGGSGYLPPNYMHPGYRPHPMRPAYGALPGQSASPAYGAQSGYGAPPGYGSYPIGYAGYNIGQHPGYVMPPSAPYMHPRPNGGYARPPSNGAQPIMRPSYGVPPAVGGGYPSRPYVNRPLPHVSYAGQGYPPSHGAPSYSHPESDSMFSKPPQAEDPSNGQIIHPPGYLGNSCSLHENDTPHSLGGAYGQYPNQFYPPYYANPYGSPLNSRALRPLPTLAYTFCQYMVGKKEDTQE